MKPLLSTLFLFFTLTLTAQAEQASEALFAQAESGDAEAQYQLFIVFKEGNETTFPDLETAIKWLQLSADQGYAAAEFDLGTAYDLGEGLEQNLELAAQWYKKAATHGESAAQYNLAVMHMSGEGVVQDVVMAHAWLTLAAANGFTDENLTPAMLEGMMTPMQLTHSSQIRARLIKD